MRTTLSFGAVAPHAWQDSDSDGQESGRRDIALDRQDRIARKTLQPILSSVDPDLRPFKRHGGKMIQYAGWADTAIAPQNGPQLLSQGPTHDGQRPRFLPRVHGARNGALQRRSG